MQNQAQTLTRYEFSEAKLGTEFRIIMYCPDSTTADKAQSQVFDLVDELDMICSDYKLDSELNKLSSIAGSGKYTKTSKHLELLLLTSYEFSSASDGAFDVTVGPLSKLWRRSMRRNEIPTEEEIKKAKQSVDYKHLVHSKTDGFKLLMENMRLDLGGIAKGFIVDQVSLLLLQLGIESHLVDAGGDMKMWAPPPEKDGWQINFSDQILSVSYRSIATSGDKFKYVEQNGKRYSHIIDPRSGYGVQNPNTVMVNASSCMIADVLASTASILSEEEMTAVLKKLESLDLNIEIKYAIN